MTNLTYEHHVRGLRASVSASSSRLVVDLSMKKSPRFAPGAFSLEHPMLALTIPIALALIVCAIAVAIWMEG